MHFMMYVQCIMHIIIILFVFSCRSSVGSGDNMTNIFIMEIFNCINILSDF